MTDIESLRKQVTKIDDGDFLLYDRSYPFYFVPPLPQSQSILYTTKFHAIQRLYELSNMAPHCGIIARYGIPHVDELEWIQQVARGRKLFFLGDCDPYDLIIYTAIKTVIDISFLGVSDALIYEMDVELGNNLYIKLDPPETRALGIVMKEHRNLEPLIGPECAAMLAGGLKLEIEAVVSHSRKNIFGSSRIIS